MFRRQYRELIGLDVDGVDSMVVRAEVEVVKDRELVRDRVTRVKASGSGSSGVAEACAKPCFTIVDGVADGVGGWRAYGIDPGEFSLHLMQTCERLVGIGRFTPSNPSELLARSYYELLQHKKAILGSSTACVVVLNKENCMLYTANIGDSGFMVVRHGKVIHKSEEQQHYFNTPFQLSLPPPGYQANVLSDQPDSAITNNFPVEDGDVILVATDGVFDNLPQSLLIKELCKVQGERCASRLQTVANSIAWMARNLSFDETFISPFAESAFANGINTIGGKPDDITVILATVAI
ncbi:hypothetical protein RN001_013162 [Aquatica leii]|uniref:Protein phosphatase n=1 Tax=Aquatica leii TaxID=1421715 RepID=A0AAN7PRC5_9COLE|nr:hypothetical protein RN001_013162 [Aquatica leii]